MLCATVYRKLSFIIVDAPIVIVTVIIIVIVLGVSNPAISLANHKDWKKGLTPFKALHHSPIKHPTLLLFHFLTFFGAESKYDKKPDKLCIHSSITLF